MHDATDMDLLRQYADGNSDAAFAALVSRHVDLVYSAALRKTGNLHAAEEITQAVFIILAQKAGRILDKTILPGWLYQTARLTASSFLRRETRRVRREQEAFMQTEPYTVAPDETWEQLAPLLEDAMGQLGDKDRAAVVLRFFGGKSFAEVATAAGVSENAAKKRVGHALEKLHRYFSRRGVSSTAAIIAGAISTHSVQVAPVALAKAVTAVAVAKGATASSSTLTLIKGALKIMAWTKAKTTIVIGVAAIFTAAVVTPIVIHGHHQPNPSGTLNSAGTTSPTSANPKTPDEATRAIFETWGKGDWNGFYDKFGEPGVSREKYDQLFNDKIKNYLEGLEVVSLGTPSNSFGPNMWFVPYKIRFRDGSEKEFRLHVAQDPKTKRWIFKGGF
jgi:RNA polymerase sigma factor (sigma-70 family)